MSDWRQRYIGLEGGWEVSRDSEAGQDVETGHSGQATDRGGSIPWLSRLPNIQPFCPSLSRRPSQSLQLSAQQLMLLQTFAVLLASHSPLHASVLPPKKSKTLTFTVRLGDIRSYKAIPSGYLSQYVVIAGRVPIIWHQTPQTCCSSGLSLTEWWYVLAHVRQWPSQALAPLPYPGSVGCKFPG